MFCPNCGAELESKDKFCRYCGSNLTASESIPIKVSEESNKEPVFTAPQKTGTALPTMGMKWYTFVVKVQLWLTMLGLLARAGQYGSGSQYGELKDQVYQVYPKMESVDIGFAALCFVLMILAFITRRELRDYEWSGVKKYMVLCALTFFTGLLYSFVASVATGLSIENMIDSSAITSAVTGVVYLVLNYIYFNKRKELFRIMRGQSQIRQNRVL